MEYIIGILLLISFVGLAVYAVRGGNLMMGMLIMGIQVLRLEYYELFSRFYRGTGREFKPYGKQNG